MPPGRRCSVRLPWHPQDVVKFLQTPGHPETGTYPTRRTGTGRGAAGPVEEGRFPGKDPGAGRRERARSRRGPGLPEAEPSGALREAGRGPSPTAPSHPPSCGVPTGHAVAVAPEFVQFVTCSELDPILRDLAFALPCLRCSSCTLAWLAPSLLPILSTVSRHGGRLVPRGRGVASLPHLITAHLS